MLDKFTEGHRPSFAVLGFGDRQFPKFCQFARDTQAALLARGWPQSLDLDTIDRQSSQEFSHWGRAVGRLLGRELTLTYTHKPPHTQALELIRRIDYGTQVQAPTSILRFGPIAPKSRFARIARRIGFNGLPRFEAGDLVGICLLYTSDAADDLLCVDFGGRRIIKKKQAHTSTCSW